MSKRLDKKKLKRQTTAIESPIIIKHTITNLFFIFKA